MRDNNIFKHDNFELYSNLLKEDLYYKKIPTKSSEQETIPENRSFEQGIGSGNSANDKSLDQSIDADDTNQKKQEEYNNADNEECDNLDGNIDSKISDDIMEQIKNEKLEKSDSILEDFLGDFSTSIESEKNNQKNSSSQSKSEQRNNVPFSDIAKLKRNLIIAKILIGDALEIEHGTTRWDKKEVAKNLITKRLDKIPQSKTSVTNVIQKNENISLYFDISESNYHEIELLSTAIMSVLKEGNVIYFGLNGDVDYIVTIKGTVSKIKKIEDLFVLGQSNSFETKRVSSNISDVVQEYKIRKFFLFTDFDSIGYMNKIDTKLCTCIWLSTASREDFEDSKGYLDYNGYYIPIANEEYVTSIVGFAKNMKRYLLRGEK